MILHVGYHKTATTWLQRHLFDNRDAGLASPWTIREVIDGIVRPHPLEWDLRAARDAFGAGRRRVEAEGLTCALSNEELAGNPHSGAFGCTIVAERLAALFPGARVLIVVRRQADLLVSVYKQYVVRGGTLSPARYFRPPAEDFRVPRFRPAHFEFHRLIELYHGHFDPDRVLVLPFESMVEDRGAFVRRIASFAGGRDPGPLPAEVVRRSPSALAVTVQRRLNRTLLRDDVNPAAPFRLHRLPDRIRSIDRRLPAAATRGAEARLRAWVADFARGRYAASNRRTAELTGLPLDRHGYELD